MYKDANKIQNELSTDFCGWKLEAWKLQYIQASRLLKYEYIRVHRKRALDFSMGFLSLAAFAVY